MRINGFRCDGCKKEHLLEPTRVFQGYSYDLPPTWFIVARGPVNRDREEEPLIFCSAPCLRDYAQEIIEVSNE